jgi:hypothetical protein
LIEYGEFHEWFTLLALPAIRVTAFILDNLLSFAADLRVRGGFSTLVDSATAGPGGK